jgi:N-acetylneuraminic acid mutarotase
MRSELVNVRRKSKISAYILRGSGAALLVSCAIVALASAISLTNHSRKVPRLEDNTVLGVNAHESASSVGDSAKRRDLTLTFADRVAYQRAIEEVYRRHRIWPKANAVPKPPLDKVMSQAQIERKVEDYLRDSQALEDYWQRPITPDQLQAEMERIASHTKQPGVLRELFAALGNDPFVIAECLARPVLAERLVTELYAHDQRFHGELKRRAEGELRAHASVDQMKQTSGMYSEIELVKSDSAHEQDSGSAEPGLKLNSQEWDESVATLAAQFHNQDIVGQAPRLPNGRSAVGAAALQKPPIAQIKTGVVSPLQEDDAHYYALAVMKKGKDRLKLATIAWHKEPLQSWLAKAEAQAPVTMAAVTADYTLPVIGRLSGKSKPSGTCTDDMWTPTNSTNAPDGRYQHTAVWTGSEMIVWGGTNFIRDFDTGGRYNPSTDSWTATSTHGQPAGRAVHTAVWTGSEMIVWGGCGYLGCGYGPSMNAGGRYNPSSDSWTASSLTNAPSARGYHTAVWTGSQMIVWGGWNGISDLNTGGKYDPSTDSWTATSTTNAPAGREYHTVVWTGSEMILWGGYNGYYLNTGGRYNPATDTWTVTSTTSAPSGRYLHTAVWTNTEMIVWGGFNGLYLNTGGRYNPSTDSWTATDNTNAPDGRYFHTAVWTGSEMIVWGGSTGVLSDRGGRYVPGTDSWTPINTTNAPSARSGHTAVWTGSEMIVWGGSSSDYLNTGGRYCAAAPAPTPTPTPTPSATISATPTPTGTATATPTASPTPTPVCIDDTWTATATINAPDARGSHTAVWTGSEMIVWGGGNNSPPYRLNSGGKYYPSTDTWVSTSLVNAPSPRYLHSAVWTGTEMIIWGAELFLNLNDGGRYNPATDEWTGVTTNNAPSVRASQTAVWTGSEMIVWGGYNCCTNFNTGGRYNPDTDSWTATSRVDAPEARWSHRAVWTGSEMIVWGGTNETIFLNTGGKYNPVTDSWVATSTTNAPTGRIVYTGIWSGSEMIVWGGFDISYNPLNSGGRYNPSTDSWTATSLTNAPSARGFHTASVWTGSEMIVWGGCVDIGCSNVLNTGGRYSAGTDSWVATSITNTPTARWDEQGVSGIWTGTQMVVWGGCGDPNCSNVLNTGGRYCAQGGPSPTPTPTASPTPTATIPPTATPTATSTPRPTPTPRINPTPRSRPTPPPRP